MKPNLFIVIVVGFIAGVLARSFFNVPFVVAVFILLLGVAGLAIFFASSSSQKAKFLLFGFILISFGVGIARYEFKDQHGISDIMRSGIGESVTLRAFVADEPDERENNTRLIFEVNSLWQNGEWRKVEGDRILIYVNRYPEFAYGDILEIKGKLQEPENFFDFDWRAYLSKDDVYLQMFYPEIEKIGEGGGSIVKRKLFAIKQNFVSALSRILPEPHASFMGGLTVGAKKSMPEDLQEDFRKVGVIHLVVLSGYNVTIIAESFGRMLFFLPIPRFIIFSLSSLIIALFALMTGASATIIRASIMAILVMIARSTGRVYEVTMALLLAGFIMIMHNPKILRFDPSFQLSFLATLGLIYLAPRLEGFVQFLPKMWGLRGHVTATISAQMMVTPLLLNMMGAVSIVALPVNILILMFVPTTMLLGLLTWLAGLVHYFVSLPFAWISWALLQYELSVVDIFARIPWASLTTPNFSIFVTLIIYGVLAFLLIKFPQCATLSVAHWGKKDGVKNKKNNKNHDDKSSNNDRDNNIDDWKIEVLED